MRIIEKVELIVKLLEEVKGELKEENSRYLSMDNASLRIKNKQLFEENVKLKENLN